MTWARRYEPGLGPHTYQWRCKMCPDFLGYQADVTVMDAWPGGPPEHHGAITEARLGVGRIMALHHPLSKLYQIHEDIRYL